PGNYASTSARQRRANAIGEIRRAASRLRDVINEGTPPQFFEWQIRIHPTGMIKITVDQPVEQMANVELAGATGGICVMYDVDRAAIGQQMIEFRPIGKFVDPLKINQQQSPHALDRGVKAIEINCLLAIFGAHADKVTFVPHHVDQFELLEERSD